MNFYRRLHIFSRRENFGALGGDCRVAFDELGHHATLGFDTE